MKYEFHAGDYIESFDGSVGYLTKVETWYSGTVGNDVVHLHGSTTFDASCGFTPFTITIPLSDISKYFNRIGQYDFTKKDEGKIEPLADNYTESFPIFKTQDTVTGKTYKQECYSIDIGAVGKKINELVEAVNRLEEKANEMVQS